MQRRSAMTLDFMLKLAIVVMVGVLALATVDGMHRCPPTKSYAECIAD
jgi:hypothetical protein